MSNGQKVFTPEPGIDMFVVQRYYRADHTTCVANIHRATDICEFIELVPKFGKAIAFEINSNNSLKCMTSYYINNFLGKETFHSILSYQL